MIAHPKLTTLIKKIIEVNDQQNSFIKLLLAQKKASKTVYSRLTLLQSEPSTLTMEEAAGKMVEAFGYDEAFELAESFSDTSIDSKEQYAWEILSEFLGQMAHAASKPIVSNRVILDKTGDDDLGADSIDDSLLSQKELDKLHGVQESFSLDIVLNEKQLAGVELAEAGKSFCFIGPAGCGKTTGQRSIASILHKSGKFGATNFRVAGQNVSVSAPSIAFVAYTRRAASNLRKAVHKDPELAEVLQHNIMTVHALLEYAPETYWDSVEMKEKFRFAPRRTADNPLTITHLVIEEASMIGLDLAEKLYDALPAGVQIIFIGDINQLPPVFGPSILNFALTQLPIVELTEVYRNQGIVLENAHNILRGESIIEDENYQIIRGSSDVQHGQSKTAIGIKRVFETLFVTKGKDGLMEYDPETDIVLSPFNKQGGRGEASPFHLGTDSLNNTLAQFIGEARNAVVHEIIAGFSKLYLAVGDKVMVNKRDGVIIEINRNHSYAGREPQYPGADLSRFGTRIIGRDANVDFDDFGAEEINYDNFSLEQLENDTAERKMQASHSVVVDFGEGLTETISGAGDFSPQVFSLGYALTVHKSQGSEWRKVFIIMHKDHSTMLFRELFYTAATRARVKVVIIAKDYIIEKAIATQRIKGDTLKDKLAFFNSGVNDTVYFDCIK